MFIDCMGEEDAGKSCLEASMTDKPFVEGQESTEGVKVKMMISQAVGHGTDKPFVEGQESTEGVKVKMMISQAVGHGTDWKELKK